MVKVPDEFSLLSFYGGHPLPNRGPVQERHLLFDAPGFGGTGDEVCVGNSVGVGVGWGEQSSLDEELHGWDGGLDVVWRASFLGRWEGPKLWEDLGERMSHPVSEHSFLWALGTDE